MKKVLILEDKPEELAVLSRMVKEVEPDAKVYEVMNEDDAYAIAMKQNIDLFMLDIILHPEKTGDQAGAEFAFNIRKVEKYLFTPILMITSLYDPKMQMYSKVHCYRFIEKPFDYDKVKKTIAEAIRFETKGAEDRNVIFHSDGLIQMVPIKDLIYIECRERRLYVKTIDDYFSVSYISCKRMLEEIDCADFTQCNRSTIVNLNYVNLIDPVNRYIHLKNCKDVLEIGPIMKKTFLEYFYDRMK